MMNMNETIEDKINALYPMMKKSNNGSVRNILGTPRQTIKQLGKSNGNYRKWVNPPSN